MRLNQTTDFGLRTLIYLATHGGERATTGEIAESFGISHATLQKVVRDLGQGGAVELKRGRDGGLSLAMPPGEISIGAMVRWLDREAALVECFHEESNQCLIASACGLRRPLAEAQEAFYRVLDRFTLEDVTGGRRRRELKELLCPPA